MIGAALCRRDGLAEGSVSQRSLFMPSSINHGFMDPSLGQVIPFVLKILIVS